MNLLFDENIDHDIVRGIKFRLDRIVLTTVQEAGLTGAYDPEILEYAASLNFILVTHDLKTVPRYANNRVRAGLPMHGVFAVPKALPVGQVIEDLILLIECSLEGEWENRVVYLPL